MKKYNWTCYKYRYDELSGSGGTVGTTEWEYVFIRKSITDGGKEAIREHIENSVLRDEYGARMEFKKCSKPPIGILIIEVGRANSRLDRARKYSEEMEMMLLERKN